MTAGSTACEGQSLIAEVSGRGQARQDYRVLGVISSQHHIINMKKQSPKEKSE